MGKGQFGFRKGEGTTDPLMEQKLKFNQNIFRGFVGIEKTYRKFNGRIIPPVLRLYGIPEELISMVMAMYRTPKTRIRTCFGTSDAFQVKVGLYRGSVLSPLIFIIVLDYISKKIMYADDIAQGLDTEKDLQSARTARYEQHYETWNEDVSKAKKEPPPHITIGVDGQQLMQASAFKYLSSWLREGGDLELEVQTRI